VFLTIAVLIGIGVSMVEGQRGAKSTSLPSSPSSGPTFVLSQVDGGGGGSTGTYINDYVEIKNVSSVPLSLNTLSLMYGSATGQFASSGTNAFALPNTTLQPGQYFLVQLGAAGTAGAALPTPDASTTNLSMSATSGKVALVTSSFTQNSCGATATPCTLPNANIVDLVSWGASNNAEGNAPTNGGTAITSSQGNVRKGNGCTDTDNNNNDFDIVTAPVPHNSASAAAPCSVAAHQHAPLDFDGDGKTDYALLRDNGSVFTWYVLGSQSGSIIGSQWGLDTDHPVPADYDGDGKTDIAVWRDGPPNQAAFYIFLSGTNTIRIDFFGQTGDLAKIVADYDGDGKADEAVYRPGANPGDQSYFFVRGSLNNPTGAISYVPWGIDGDVPTSGDFDGDGKADFVVRRDSGGQGVYYLLKSGGGTEVVFWGLSTDSMLPGDYDGDGKSDFCVARINGNSYNVFILTRTGGGTGASPIVFASQNSNDDAAFGDYDGDGKIDVGIFRRGDASGNSFWIRSSADGSVTVKQWGQQNDRALGEWNITGGN
jgi:hypothetical protein